jgi:pimeloyl-ACP methyl ester carboxylesterase
LVYDGDSLHQWIDADGAVTIDYLADRLGRFLDEFVQRPPYYLVGSSLGSQVILTYANKQPEKVSKLVLICPSGFHGDENLPLIEGVQRTNYDSLVRSVFHRDHFPSDELVLAFQRKFQNRKWKKGVLRTLRGTVGHSVASLLPLVSHPTLIIWGANDRVLSDVPGAIRAAGQIPRVRQVVIPKCGHAPQIEKARLVNQLISKYLRDKLKTIPPDLDAYRFLTNVSERQKARAGFLATPLNFAMSR